VIIISCVRSSPEYVKMDEQFKLGFLRNPKRCAHKY
jgi:superfamily I DNA and/or RNA helicase